MKIYSTIQVCRLFNLRLNKCSDRRSCLVQVQVLAQSSSSSTRQRTCTSTRTGPASGPENLRMSLTARPESLECPKTSF